MGGSIEPANASKGEAQLEFNIKWDKGVRGNQCRKILSFYSEHRGNVGPLLHFIEKSGVW